MKLKKLISYILLSICLPIFCLPLFGFTAEGRANIYHNGKGNATFFVESTLDESAFEATIKQTLAEFNDISGSSDIITLQDIEKADGVYEVSVALRRIDKVKPRGYFYLHTAEYLKKKQSVELDRLSFWELGNVSGSANIYYNGLKGSATIYKPSDGGQKFVVAPTSADGKATTVKNFAKNVAATNQILAFQMFDTMGVQKVQISLPGTITYCSNNVKLIDESTFEVTPAVIRAEVQKNDQITLETITTNEDVNMFIGYVAFEKSVSPTTITVIAIVCALVVGFVVFVLAYFYHRGKKLQEQEDAEKELEDERTSLQQ